MKIEYEDLQVGDEVIFSSNGNLRMVRIVAPPKKDVKRWYKSIRCEGDLEKKTTSYVGWDKRIYNRTKTEWNSLSDNYKNRVTVNFYGKDIWLVKRNGEFITEQA